MIVAQYELKLPPVMLQIRKIWMVSRKGELRYIYEIKAMSSNKGLYGSLMKEPARTLYFIFTSLFLSKEICLFNRNDFGVRVLKKLQ